MSMPRCRSIQKSYCNYSPGRRGDMFDKRRRLMNAWAAFCLKNQSPVGEVVSLFTASNPARNRQVLLTFSHATRWVRISLMVSGDFTRR